MACDSAVESSLSGLELVFEVGWTAEAVEKTGSYFVESVL